MDLNREVPIELKNMNQQVYFYLDKMLSYEKAGHIEEAFLLYDKILQAFENEREDILIEGAKMKFRQRHDKDALFDFIDAYDISYSEELFQTILDIYFIPNRKKYIKLYEKNCSALKNYSYYYNLKDDLKSVPVVPIWNNDEYIIWADINEKKFCKRKKNPIIKLPNSSDVVIVTNELWENNLLEIEYATRLKEEDKFMDLNIPLYFVYDKEVWKVFLQIWDVKKFIDTNRVIFLIGMKSLEHFFREDMVIFPKIICNQEYGESFIRRLPEIWSEIMSEDERYGLEIESYYRGRESSIEESIRSGKPRILFLTSRFTTVLQYHTRDLKNAAEGLGCKTKLLMEKDGVHSVTPWYVRKCVAELKPDIIMSLDHFRFENQDLGLPSEIMWITWVQDPMPYIMDKETPGKLTERDIILTHFISWKEFDKIGYPKDRLIDAPIPANSHIYKKYSITESEYQKYACDICLVCHGGAVEKRIEEILHFFSDCTEEIRREIDFIYRGYYSFVHETGQFFFYIEQFKEYIQGVTRRSFYREWSKNTLDYIAEDMLRWFNQNVFRQCIVDWLIEAGYTNIKLWGNGWLTEKKYEKYAMGPAENGETLSKIYQCSKIVLGNNIGGTGAARAWESMLSGAFYMSNYVPPEADAIDIRKIVKENEELIMFYDKQDLLDKVKYYLTHEKERQKMAQIGKKAALERMTFDNLMERVIKSIPPILEKNGKKECEMNG